MKLNVDLKTDIQVFVYFLFSGALYDSNSKNQADYIENLVYEPTLLYNCFEIFAYSMQNPNSMPPNSVVIEYIEKNTEGFQPQIDEIVQFNRQQLNFWSDFLELAHKFCFDELQEYGVTIDVISLKGNGTGAVSFFAVWTNIVEVDTHNRIINSEYAFNRLLQRFSKNRDGKDISKFEDWEIEQEIY